ncbi:hypothetical protein BJ166DRAFT_507631 [Pestalotiopsis sp. NC0098]|nr:hypothetical protein BJ166DRAFT_507631 [Pestalotiopsis sp. NC0098]
MNQIKQLLASQSFSPSADPSLEHCNSGPAMASQDVPKDDASQASFGAPSPEPEETLATNSTLDDEEDHFGGLLPGHTYMILERESLRAITLTSEGLRLRDVQEGQEDLSNRWLCVEKNGWLGLQEPKSGKFIGHGGSSALYAKADKFQAWECITTRDRPGGVYQLLVPHWLQLKMIVVAEDGEGLITREHGKTLWRFLKTSGS